MPEGQANFQVSRKYCLSVIVAQENISSLISLLIFCVGICTIEIGAVKTCLGTCVVCQPRERLAIHLCRIGGSRTGQDGCELVKL
jgi:hypothetical protein